MVRVFADRAVVSEDSRRGGVVIGSILLPGTRPAHLRRMQPGDRLLGTFLLNVWSGARGSLLYMLASRECWVSGLFRFALGGDFGDDDTVQVLLGALFTLEHGAVQSTGGTYRYIRG